MHRARKGLKIIQFYPPCHATLNIKGLSLSHMLCLDVRFSRPVQVQNNGRSALAEQMFFSVFVAHALLTEEHKEKHPDEKQA